MGRSAQPVLLLAAILLGILRTAISADATIFDHRQQRKQQLDELQQEQQQQQQSEAGLFNEDGTPIYQELAQDDPKENEKYVKHVSSLLPHASFQAPFNVHDDAGQRLIPGWTFGGDAVVKQSFLRVAPDRPYASGWAWSTRGLSANDFSVEWKFRISGLSESGAGEHLGLWITDQKEFREGPLFGCAEKFTGVGVIVDTYRRAEDAKHRDISMVTNNGRKDGAQVMTELQGCNANLRYWEGRDDFTVLKSSRLRLRFSDNTLILEVDSRNSGRWRRCARVDKADLPRSWAYRSYVGLQAANEDQSNNADVLSLKVYKSPEAAWALEQYTGEDDDGDEWALLVHHMEHEMFTVQQGLESAVHALEAAEEAAQARIAALEGQINMDITKALESRLRSLESHVHSSVARSVGSKVHAAERTLAKKMEATLEGSAKNAARAWRVPFVLLSGAVGALCLLSWFKYRELRKEHLL